MIRDSLETIDRALLANTSGGGPSLGDRQNPSAPPLQRSTPPSFSQSQSSWGGMDAGMVKMPSNPNVDLGGAMHPMGIGNGGFAGALDI